MYTKAFNVKSDFAADVSMARQNMPRMGFSACFGAPLLSILLFILVITERMKILLLSVLF
jgi:Ca2+/Na+ antiporter